MFLKFKSTEVKINQTPLYKLKLDQECFKFVLLTAMLNHN